MNGLEVAVIGMSCRLPGADTIGQYWDNLVNGVESVSFFSEEEIAQFSERLTSNPNYVNAKGGVIANPYCFDAELFGYTPNEARLMDPQIRIMHEMAWAALEDAGYAAPEYPGKIGFFASAGQNSYWEIKALYSKLSDAISSFASGHISQKDYIASLVSYKLNLRGPVVFLSTACSSSLVGVHLAVRALLGAECDIALAGGISVPARPAQGYAYEKHMVLSSDGHCRAFDAKADGTIYGQGGGVVVLKLLDAAVRDKDNILAVIKGTAVNNDGSRKISYTAPGLHGQEAVIRDALLMAGTPADTIGMIETHGTGTAIGDPIEIQALTNVYNLALRDHCAIGSVKTNIGHTDTAAGIAGLIKCVLSLHHRTLVPSLHFETPNPRINFSKTPFYVNTVTKPWPQTVHPRRSGLSCFGVGGTNVHLVAEEYVADQPVSAPGPFIVSFSAQSQAALDQYSGDLLLYLKKQGPVSMSSLSYTLHMGRSAFRYRMAITASSQAELAEKLERRQSLMRGIVSGSESCVLLFPGQGMQYPGMGGELYQQLPRFRKTIDYCAAIIKELQGCDIRDYIDPARNKSIDRKDIFRQSIAQPLIFSVEYALATVLEEWGIKPACMMGQSIGEYVAACIAGVFGPEQALKLVCIRGRLMEQLPAGAMVYVPVEAAKVSAMLPSRLSIAIVNEPGCVVSGSPEDIQAFETDLKKKRIITMRLDISHAGHSFLLDSMQEVYGDALRALKPAAPKIPFISNTTGTWIKPEEATDPQYWIDHLTSTILLSDSIQTLCSLEKPVFIEAGPGNSLTSIAGRFREQHTLQAVNLLLPPNQEGSAMAYLHMRLGQLWAWGLPVSWKSWYGASYKKISLPGYPFQRKTFTLDELQLSNLKQQPAARKPDPLSWLYLPGWKRKNLFPLTLAERKVLVLHGNNAFDKKLTALLQEKAVSVIDVAEGAAYCRVSATGYQVVGYEDLQRVFAALAARNQLPDTIIYLVPCQQAGIPDPQRMRFVETAIYQVVQELARINGRRNNKVNLLLVTDSLWDVTGQERPDLSLAVIPGLLRSINQEFANLNCSQIDFMYEQEDAATAAELLLQEDAALADEKIVAYRHGHRWVQSFDPAFAQSTVQQQGDVFRRQGVYLLAGGLGNIGFIIALHLAEQYAAQLVITGRRSLPPRHEWEAILAAKQADPALAMRLTRILQLEHAGATVHYHACDVTDKEAMQQVIHAAVSIQGRIDGIVYGVTEIPDEQKLPISMIGKKEIATQFHAKVYGLLVLHELIKELTMDFCLLMSSQASIMGGLGYSAYAAANSFMDGFAMAQRSNRKINYVSLNNSGWVYYEQDLKLQRVSPSERNYKVSPEEGWNLVKTVLALRMEPQVLVYLSDLDHQLKNWVNMQKGAELHPVIVEEQVLAGRPELTTAYQAPQTAMEKELVHIWSHILGAEVGTKDDFFELGGDSLKAIRMIARVENSLGKNISLKEFLESRTIEQIGRLLDSRDGSVYRKIPRAEKKHIYPLSSAQQRLYFQQRAHAGSIAYNEQICLRVKGTPEPERIAAVINTIAQRHEILRTAFIEADGIPGQRILESVEIPVTMKQLPMHTETSVRATLRDFVKPFRLDQPPFLRVLLLGLNAQESILLSDMHHIITDGVSFNLFKHEFQSLLTGTALPGQPLQYKDYSEWKYREQRSAVWDRQQAFWQDRFEGDDTPGLQLPADELPPGAEEAGAGQLSVSIAGEQALRFRQLLADHQVTVFNGLLALCNILLARITRQDAISIISPVLGRKREELQHTLGAFINMVVFHNEPAGDLSFIAFLKKVQAATAEVFDNDEYPFEQLISFLKRKRADFTAPVFDVMFTVRDLVTEQPAPMPGELHFEYYDIDVYRSKYKLQLAFEEKKDAIELLFIYDAGHLSLSTMQLLKSWFLSIAATAIDDPHQLLGAIRPGEEAREVQGELEGMFDSFDY